MGGSQSGGGDGGGTEGELGAMDRAACLNMNTRPFQHRSTSRFHIIARRQAWGHTRVAPGNPPIEMTNALVVSSLAPPSTPASPIATPPSTDVVEASGKHPTGPSTPPEEYTPASVAPR